ncbi:hypothetical protein [Xylophilus sp. GOD-11R]|uniref:hypothetical protein n=1 Tax=Xylophilus sp. GOD-11R TaxID=3089814 RepID=UPI00298CCEC4|nr:hypothetical protein [Xylophilus sp. GOD-11R]WPB59154.1 hypothetical protein R9X41_11120 [Xylophilus sp. GOD-11R]
MKKIALAIAAATLLASQAFAQSPTGPVDGTGKSPQLPAGSAAKPGGVGTGMGDGGKAAMPGTPTGTRPRASAASMAKPGGAGEGAVTGADKPAAASKSERQMAREERRARMKSANKSGEIPSPTVSPKSY